MVWKFGVNKGSFIVIKNWVIIRVFWTDNQRPDEREEATILKYWMRFVKMPTILEIVTIGVRKLEFVQNMAELELSLDLSISLSPSL